jgi:hypothetical protein
VLPDSHHLGVHVFCLLVDPSLLPLAWLPLLLSVSDF